MYTMWLLYLLFFCSNILPFQGVYTNHSKSPTSQTDLQNTCDSGCFKRKAWPHHCFSLLYQSAFCSNCFPESAIKVAKPRLLKVLCLLPQSWHVFLNACTLGYRTRCSSKWTSGVEKASSSKTLFPFSRCTRACNKQC